MTKNQTLRPLPVPRTSRPPTRRSPPVWGLSFAPKSKRYVTPAQAADLKRGLDPCHPSGGGFCECPAGGGGRSGQRGGHRPHPAPWRGGEAYLQNPSGRSPPSPSSRPFPGHGGFTAAAEASGATWSCWTQERAAQGRPLTGPCWLQSAGPTSLAGVAPGERRPGSSPPPSLRGWM